MAWLADLLHLARGIDRVADALERIADAQEGRPRLRPAELVEAADTAELEGIGRDDGVMLHLDLLRTELTPLYGREPTEDELEHYLDEVEWTAADADGHRERIRKLYRKEGVPAP